MTGVGAFLASLGIAAVLVLAFALLVVAIDGRILRRRHRGGQR